MKIEANLPSGVRWAFALAGVAIIAAPFVIDLNKWIAAIGVIVLLEGVVGF